ncbi:aminoglycoside phosphotransferase family protein [Streptomyces sp. ME19-01-6]|uniref:aminoglycoside phosphotransferase family protein n=1 Tax=Streptomyces sp. ME19-01-6 TaxID=3028686 RepID=UPI0029A7540A|nr:aminoglycoside phosphotransferase family protein [Streptomyces sp. ME19-01-6]MDX3231321.1 aminoglycoside phosphotransferase family protein [Streptomyces sp. ME19-01-6]
MAPVEAEVPLPGGRITQGVVRIGGTVRRPASAASSYVADLLRHLTTQGFTGSPRYLGRDPAGRDTFTYLPGWVPPRFQCWTDSQVAAAGALLRALHDATRGSALAGPHPVVCHHDPGPNNTVFRDGRPVALIDFDTAAPGDPLEDLGYMAWTWCIASKAEAPPVDAQAARVRVLADAYGLSDHGRARLLDAILDRQARNADWWHAHLLAPAPRIATEDQIAERIAWSRREHAFTTTHRRVFSTALR